MKIQLLFDELVKATTGKNADFEASGIINCFDKMKYGFFPLGLGILKENVNSENAIIEEGGIMVLGNDFGTVAYVRDKCNKKGEGETNISKTIDNLLNKKAGLDVNINKTFFTNLYLGVRIEDGIYVGTTMTKRMYNGRVNRLKPEYKELCYDFFLTQLKFIDPRIVVCLGRNEKNALAETKLFPEWGKLKSIKSIYSEKKSALKIKELGDRKFIIIPHPCDLRNFRKEHIDNLANELKMDN